MIGLSLGVHGTNVSVFTLNPERDKMAAVQREDYRAIWDCTEDHWQVSTYIIQSMKRDMAAPSSARTWLDQNGRGLNSFWT